MGIMKNVGITNVHHMNTCVNNFLSYATPLNFFYIVFLLILVQRVCCAWEVVFYTSTVLADTQAMFCSGCDNTLAYH